jgi:hypothetical protein
MAKIATDKSSWASAYKDFILDSNESFMLKIAPLAIIFGAPEVLVSNVIPVVGEFVDVGSISVASIILARTYFAVRKHR